MRLYHDLDSGLLGLTLGVAQPVTEIEVKRSPLAPIEIQFVRGGIVQELGSDATGIFEVKVQGQYDSQPLTAALAWVKTGTGVDTVYTFTIVLINEPLDALLGVNVEPTPFTANATTNLLTSAAHGLLTGTKLHLSSDDTLPAPLQPDTDYFVIAAGLTANDFAVSTTLGGSAVDITDTGTGNHFWVRDLPDAVSVTLMAELQFYTNGQQAKSQTFNFKLVNDVVRDGDVPPSTPPLLYAIFLPEVTTMAEFKAVPTTGMFNGTLVEILIDVLGAKSWLTYRKVPGPATEAEPEHVEPDDYDAVDNDVHWEGAVGPSGVAGRSAGNPFEWSTDTTATDPTSGKLKVNHATLASATALYISETDMLGSGLGALLATWDDGTSTVRGRIFVQDVATPTNFAIFDITGTRTDNGAWDTFTIVPVTSGGTLTNGLDVYVSFFAKGDKGDGGSAGGLPYLWNTNTASSDPTTGHLKVNNATIASATALYISETDNEANALAALLATWDDGTSTIKGQLYIKDPSTPTNFAIFNITGTITDNGGWDTFTIAHVSSGGAFSNELPLRLTFVPKGDKGDDGATGGGGGASAIASVPYKFDDSTTPGSPAAGYLRGDNASFDSSTTLYVSVDDSDSVDWSSFFQAWSGGKVVLSSVSNPQIFFVFPFTAYAFTGGHNEFTIGSVLFTSLAGSFSLDDDILISFLP